MRFLCTPWAVHEVVCEHVEDIAIGAAHGPTFTPHELPLQESQCLSLPAGNDESERFSQDSAGSTRGITRYVRAYLAYEISRNDSPPAERVPLRLKPLD